MGWDLNSALEATAICALSSPHCLSGDRVLIHILGIPRIDNHPARPQVLELQAFLLRDSIFDTGSLCVALAVLELAL